MKHYTSEIIEAYVEKLSKKIKELNKQSTNISTPPNISENIQLIIDKLKNNPYSIEDISNEELIEILKKHTGISVKDELFEKISIVRALAAANKEGINFDLLDSEKETINQLVELLTETLNAELREYATFQQEVNKSKLEIEKYRIIYDKLRAGFEGTEYIISEEVSILSELSKDDTFENRKNLLFSISSINKKVERNRLLDLQNTETKKEKVKTEIDEELIKELFKKYGYTLNNMPEKIYKALRTKCKYNEIVKIFEALTSDPRYNFTKDYGVPNQNKTARMIKQEFLMLYHILRYATPAILKHLSNDAPKYQVTLEEIFRIRGVFKHNTNKTITLPGGGGGQTDDLSIDGAFDNYRKNTLLFEEIRQYIKETEDIDINYYKEILESSPSSFTTNPETTKASFEIAKLYGIPFTYKGELTSIKGLTSKHLLERLDTIIETGNHNLMEYTQIRKSSLNYSKVHYESILAYHYGNCLVLSDDNMYYKRNESRELWATYYGTDCIASLRRPHLEQLRSEIPAHYIRKIEIIDEIDILNLAEAINLDYSDEYIEKLEQYHDEKDTSKLGQLSYNINGVYISRLKFRKIWKALMEMYDQDVEIEKMLLFALTYKSYYTEQEFEVLKKFAYGLNLS